MLAGGETAAYMYRRSVYRVQAEFLHTGNGADDVQYRVQRSDFVEMQIFHSTVVDVRFDLGQLAENGNDGLLDVHIKMADADDPFDIGKVPFRLRFQHLDSHQYPGKTFT